MYLKKRHILYSVWQLKLCMIFEIINYKRIGSFTITGLLPHTKWVTRARQSTSLKQYCIGGSGWRRLGYSANNPSSSLGFIVQSAGPQSLLYKSLAHNAAKSGITFASLAETGTSHRPSEIITFTSCCSICFLPETLVRILSGFKMWCEKRNCNPALLSDIPLCTLYKFNPALLFDILTYMLLCM